MVVSTHHLHQQHLCSDASNENDDDDDDDFLEEESGSGCLNHHQPRLPRSLMQSHTVFGDHLSDVNSELARFLFVGRDCTQEENNSDNEVEELPSMGTFNVLWFTLALEPIKNRNERIIMIFEAFAIFGTLFMNGVWILYEWGSRKGYGGDDTNIIVDRVFECVMANALGGNVLLAFFGAWYWVFSINMNSSHEDYVVESRKALMFLYYLAAWTVTLASVGFYLGVYSNLSPYWPETSLTIFILMIISLIGTRTYNQHFLACAPLECYHVPQWWKSIANWGVPLNSKKVRQRAKLRAQELRKRGLQRKEEKNRSQLSSEDRRTTSSVVVLLKTAATRLGRADYDVSIFEARLEQDWFNEADQLNNMSVECLSRYMPLRLAQEVQKLLQTDLFESCDQDEVQSTH
ncbi:hypothetical protein ACHAXR_009998 [Thalassiosira sp. AJA248-18]